jgi:hypothetical protein
MSHCVADRWCLTLRNCLLRNSKAYIKISTCYVPFLPQWNLGYNNVYPVVSWYRTFGATCFLHLQAGRCAQYVTRDVRSTLPEMCAVRYQTCAQYVTRHVRSTLPEMLTLNCRIIIHNVILVHTMKAHGGMALQPHLFLTWCYLQTVNCMIRPLYDRKKSSASWSGLDVSEKGWNLATLGSIHDISEAQTH